MLIAMRWWRWWQPRVGHWKGSKSWWWLARQRLHAFTALSPLLVISTLDILVVGAWHRLNVFVILFQIASGSTWCRVLDCKCGCTYLAVASFVGKSDFYK